MCLAFAGRDVIVDLDMSVERGKSLAVVGPSGSGKTTLLRCLSGLSRPDSGKVVVGGVELGLKNRRELAALRRSAIGQVFQFGELLPELTVFENVALPLLLDGQRVHRSEIELLLDSVGIKDLANARPSNLSGGETQRTGVARALVLRPSVLLCDEPTGALDGAMTDVIADLLLNRATSEGVALVVSTHDLRVASRMDRVLSLAGGRLVEAVL